MNRPVTITLFLCSCAAWAVSLSFAGGIARFAGTPGAPAAFQTEAAISASFAIVEKALALPPVPDAVRYSGGYESPFKTVSEARRHSGPGGGYAAPVPHRPRLVLKGILYKNNPLAILEDASGKTSILGVGDTLYGQNVAGIGKTTVTLRDKRGTYEISVKE